MDIENQEIEFKEKLSKGFSSEVVAFLNTRRGGVIYVGVDDDGKIVGLEDVDDIQLKIKDKIKNNIAPSTMGLFEIVIEEKNYKKIVKILISSGPDKPYYLKKQGMTPEGCFIRIGSSKEHMSERDISLTFSKRIRNSLKELNSPRQELTFNQLKIYYEEQNIQLGDNFLKNLDLLTSEGKYNFNAFLLADENNVSIQLVKYLGTSKIDLIENREFGNCCLLTVCQKILDRLDSENKTFSKIYYYGRKQQEMIDSVALREVVINAIVHNDYSYGNAPIFEIYSDRIEITSSGGLPNELEKEDFFSGVVYRRNKELIRVFKDVGLVENMGSGVIRILNAYGRECFMFMNNYLRVCLKFKENNFEYEKKDKYDKILIDRKVRLTETDILLFCESPKSIKEIMSEFGFKDRKEFKKRYINSLIAKQLLEMTIPEHPTNKNQRYITVKKI